MSNATSPKLYVQMPPEHCSKISEEPQNTKKTLQSSTDVGHQPDHVSEVSELEPQV